jgi:hypothetical protein
MNSTSYPLTNGVGLNVNFPHGLASVPAFVRSVLICTTNDPASGALVGQELDISCFYNINNPDLPFGFGADATKIYLIYAGDNAGDCEVKWTQITTYPISSFANFSMKVYWQ